MNKKTPVDPAVKSLVKEAQSAHLVTYLEKQRWLQQKLRTGCRDPEIVIAFFIRMNWRFFSKETIRTLCAREAAKAEAFDSATDLWAEARQRWPIKEYCERFLHLRFKGHKTKCPMHHDIDPSLVIDPTTNKFTCFGSCAPLIADAEHLTGDVIDLHAWRLQTDRLSARDDLLARRSLRPPAISPSAPGPIRLKPESKADRAQIGEALAAGKHVTIGYLAKRSQPSAPEAKDFAEILLRLVGSGLPIIFEKSFKAPPAIGGRAKLLLRTRPETLQYVCCSTAKTTRGRNRYENLRERLFLDVEWDHLPLADQLKLLWYLKTVKGWPLLAITFSGHESYHGLFLVQGRSESKIFAMRAQALALGACPKSMNRHQPVRFPGGYNPKFQVRQTILYLNPEACTAAKQMVKFSNERKGSAGNTPVR